MSLGEDERDELAHALAQSDFDAVERGDFRAEWADDDQHVIVTALDDGEETVYDGEDLVRAASDQEVSNARTEPPNDRP